MFDFWTNSQYGTSRIEIAGTMQYDPAVWKYEGKFSIDQLPADQFPFRKKNTPLVHDPFDHLNTKDVNI